MGYLAPAGTAIGPHTAAAGLLAGLAGPGAYATLATQLAAHAGAARGWLTSTGRAAMAVTLKAMHAQNPGRDEVIVPGYTCYSVPAAVKLAGLKPRLCDVDPRTLSLEANSLERFDTRRVLAVVSANLYGIPNDLVQIESFARARGIQMLDDAAQALGASLGGRPVGGFGDAGLYSFDKGKNITSIEGGAIVARGALISELDRQFAALTPTSARRTLVTAAKLLVYSLMLRPGAYALMNRLPLGLGQTPWEDDYPLGHYSPVLAAVALRLYARLGELTRARSANAQGLAAALRDAADVRLPELLPGAECAWARFPLFMASEKRARAVAALQAAGIGATASYPQALCDVPQVIKLVPAEDLVQPGARAVAASIMTLPTHQYVPADLGPRVRDLLRRA